MRPCSLRIAFLLSSALVFIPVDWALGKNSGSLGSLQGLAAQVTLQPPVSDTVQRVVLMDGSSFFARVITSGEGRVLLETVGGDRLDVSLDRIRSLTPARGSVVEGEFWTEDPNRTRLLVLAPTGRTLDQGEGYLSTFWVFLPFVSYGLTDRITLSGGTPLLPEVIGRVVYLAPKVGVYSRPGLDLAAGSIAFFATEEVDEGSLGLLYGVGTFGSPDRSISAGAGWAFAIGSGDSWLGDEPVLLLGGEYRIRRNLKLITENYLVPGGEGILSGGLRFFGERLSVDFGVAAVTESTSTWLPVLNFIYNFGGRN